MGNGLQCGVYEHYKGKRYLVIGIAKHTETEEMVVVYVPLYDVKGPQMSVRPFAMFTEEVTVEGQRVPRFRFVGEA